MKLPILLFDADCSFCVRFTQGIKLIDKEKIINLIPIQDEAIYNEFESLTFEDCSETIHLITAEKKILKGSEAIKELVSIIPTAAKFSWLIESNSAQKAVDAFYSKVNDIRKNKRESGCSGCGRRRSRSEIKE